MTLLILALDWRETCCKVLREEYRGNLIYAVVLKIGFMCRWPSAYDCSLRKGGFNEALAPMSRLGSLAPLSIVRLNVAAAGPNVFGDSVDILGPTAGLGLKPCRLC